MPSRQCRAGVGGGLGRSTAGPLWPGDLNTLAWGGRGHTQMTRVSGCDGGKGACWLFASVSCSSTGNVQTLALAWGAQVPSVPAAPAQREVAEGWALGCLGASCSPGGAGTALTSKSPPASPPWLGAAVGQPGSGREAHLPSLWAGPLASPAFPGQCPPFTS